ncbi:MAG: phage polymerase-related protein [Conexibacter sp.]|nr:phage polymerase-related protein [Conexibacter sp.]
MPGGDSRPNEHPPPPVPERPTLPRLRAAVQECRACELWACATQAVLGEGRPGARAMLVGEQPGDREDLEGAPFVGPAGRVLDEALEEAGIVREQVYLTNVVKHFRYRARGKRRIHQRPTAAQIAACRPWLDAELAVVRPRVLVPLGATAAQALLGSRVRVTRDRGVPLETELAPCAIVTVHPSSVLRAPDATARHDARAAFVRDLRRVAEQLRAA